MKKKSLVIIFGVLLIFNASKAQNDTFIYQGNVFEQLSSLDYQDYSLKIYVNQNNLGLSLLLSNCLNSRRFELYFEKMGK